MRPLSTLSVLALVVSLSPGVASGQGFGMPSRLAEVELERSRACVGVLEQVEALDAEMAPLARRSERLQAIAQAIALEDRSVVEPLDPDDPLETRVQEWFVSDQALAQRYLNQQDASLQAERAAGRENIKAAVSRAMEEVQQEAQTAIQANQELLASAAPCDGAIFVRSAVLEACEDASGSLCEQARLPASEVSGVRFVDEAASIWEIEQSRPWTTPTSLRPGQTGLEGGRTIGYTRVGNVVASVAFTPLFAPRDQIPPATLQAYEANNDSLGLTFDHPRIAFTPALAVRLALPRPLDREDGYILHFGTPDQADVVWSGDAGTGAPLQATVALAPSHVRRLVAGDRLTVTAITRPAAEAESPEAVYAVGIGTVSQAQNAQAILQYMAQQLQDDLTRLVPPSAGSS